MIDQPYIEGELGKAKEFEAKLIGEVKPYLAHYRMAARIKRKLAKVRKLRRQFEAALKGDVQSDCG